VHSGWTQKPQTNFSFVDLYGDTLIITNVDKLPPQLDTTFFKTNLTGAYFNTTLTQKTFRYNYFLSDIRRTKNKNEFKFELIIVPHTKIAEEIIKYLGGPGHYLMSVKKSNNGLLIDKIKFLNGEI